MTHCPKTSSSFSVSSLSDHPEQIPGSVVSDTGCEVEPQLGKHSFRCLTKVNGLTVYVEKQPDVWQEYCVEWKYWCVRKPGNTWVGELDAVIWLKYCWKRRLNPNHTHTIRSSRSFGKTVLAILQENQLKRSYDSSK